MPAPLGVCRGPTHLQVRPVRRVYEDHQMNSSFFEAVSGLAEIMWLMAIALFLIITAPVWLLPYTAFKVWKNLRSNA